MFETKQHEIVAELAEPKNRWPKNDRKIELEKTHSLILGAFWGTVTGTGKNGQAYGRPGRKKRWGNMKINI